MSRPYLPFVDWLKAVGLALIVFDHVAHWMLPWATPPFYPKQLGVAMFVFVTGYTLAHERRGLPVVIARWFEVWVYGLLLALLMTSIGLLTRGRGDPSNYLPLAGGLNVLFDNFPANPTTWYIGTYLHLLLVWAVFLRGRVIGVGLIAGVLVLEVVVRALLVESAGLYIAYQALFNWLTVLLLGLYAGGRGMLPNLRLLPIAITIVVVVPLVMTAVVWGDGFPFMRPIDVAGPPGVLLMSAAVTASYSLHTVAGFNLLGLLPAGPAVRFVARNTLLVFIGHMPVYYAMEAQLAGTMPRLALSLLEFAVALAGLAAVSELLRPAIRPLLHTVRDRLVQASRHEGRAS
jgi:hypothetical protein